MAKRPSFFSGVLSSSKNEKISLSKLNFVNWFSRTSADTKFEKIEKKNAICAKPKNRFRNSVWFLLKCKKKGTLVGPTFFGTFFRQKHGKNSDASKQK